MYVAGRINGVPAAYAALFLSRPSIDLRIGVDLRALLRSSQKPAKIADFLHAQSRRRSNAAIAPPILVQAVDALWTAVTTANASRKKIYQQPPPNDLRERHARFKTRESRKSIRPTRAPTASVRHRRSARRGIVEAGEGSSTVTDGDGFDAAHARARASIAPGRYRSCRAEDDRALAIGSRSTSAEPRRAAGRGRGKHHIPSLDFRSSLTACGLALPPEAFIT